MHTVSYRITGRVQGVGFRYLAAMVAEREQMHGTVKNESDGSVTIVLQGSQADRDAFFSALKKEIARSYGAIGAIETTGTTEREPFPDFRVVY